MEQLSQIIGAVLILTAYILAQAKLVDQRSYAYLILNFAGSAVLAMLALHSQEWGFLLLEGSWAVVTAIGLADRCAAAMPQPDHHRDVQPARLHQ